MFRTAPTCTLPKLSFEVFALYRRKSTRNSNHSQIVCSEVRTLSFSCVIIRPESSSPFAQRHVLVRPVVCLNETFSKRNPISRKTSSVFVRILMTFQSLIPLCWNTLHTAFGSVLHAHANTWLIVLYSVHRPHSVCGRSSLFFHEVIQFVLCAPMHHGQGEHGFGRTRDRCGQIESLELSRPRSDSLVMHTKHRPGIVCGNRDG